MKLHSTALSLILICWTAAAFAEEKIEGAFGKKFGEIFEPGNAPSQQINKVTMYRIQPPKPFAMFTEYFVIVTARTHRIFAIVASGPMSENAEAAQKALDLLEVILRAKYKSDASARLEPEQFPDVLAYSSYNFNLSQQTRSITASFNEKIWIHYLDLTLQKEAVREQALHDEEKRAAEVARFKAEAAKLDTSGL